MNFFCHFHRHITLLTSAMLLTVSVAAYADDMQDANKLFKQGQHGQALEKVNKFLAGKPSDPQARFLKGLILTEQGKIDNAIATFTSLTEDYPELPEPYNNLAVLYANQNDYDKAKTALEMAIRTHPSYATAHENLGDIYAKMASKAYDRALQLDRSNTTTQTKLAMIQDLFAGGGRKSSARATAKAGKKSKAIEELVDEKPAESVAEKAADSAPASSGGGNSGEVVSAVQDWAAAWSAKDVGKYLAYYAPDFKAPGGESRSSWEATRTERINKPKSIQVTVSRPSVKFSDANHATVTFKQSYNASHLKSTGGKTLEMVKVDGKWLIVEEISK